jgi:membrane-bound lytic murein transglycosylase MltF
MANPFQKLLAEMAAGIPARYLAAVADHESSFDPKAVNGHATGLFQITTVVLKDYNAQHGTTYTRADLLDPILNTRIAVDHIHRIIDLYSAIPALRPDWTSRRWVELLTLGWNAGHSAVARVAQQMKKAGVPPERTTIDTVHSAAVAMQYPGHLADEKHVGFARRVTAAYFRGPPREEVASLESPNVGKASGAGTAVAILAPLGALALGKTVLEPRSQTKRRRKS